MRIIAGTAGGRPLRPPDDGRVRPTADRVKEAWFSSLAPRLRGATVLDLYSGTGALALEAASRGAGQVVAVERDRDALAIIDENVGVTALGVTVVAADVAGALGVGGGGPHPAVAALVPVDVVVADPPYRMDVDELHDVLAAVVPLLAADAQVWLESHRHGRVRWPAGLGPVRSRRYGDTLLHTAEPTADATSGGPA